MPGRHQSIRQFAGYAAGQRTHRLRFCLRDTPERRGPSHQRRRGRTRYGTVQKHGTFGGIGHCLQTFRSAWVAPHNARNRTLKAAKVLIESGVGSVDAQPTAGNWQCVASWNQAQPADVMVNAQADAQHDGTTATAMCASVVVGGSQSGISNPASPVNLPSAESVPRRKSEISTDHHQPNLPEPCDSGLFARP